MSEETEIKTTTQSRVSEINTPTNSKPNSQPQRISIKSERNSMIDEGRELSIGHKLSQGDSIPVTPSKDENNLARSSGYSVHSIRELEILKRDSGDDGLIMKEEFLGNESGVICGFSGVVGEIQESFGGAVDEGKIPNSRDSVNISNSQRGSIVDKISSQIESETIDSSLLSEQQQQPTPEITNPLQLIDIVLNAWSKKYFVKKNLNPIIPRKDENFMGICNDSNLSLNVITNKIFAIVEEESIHSKATSSVDVFDNISNNNMEAVRVDSNNVNVAGTGGTDSSEIEEQKIENTTTVSINMNQNAMDVPSTPSKMVPLDTHSTIEENPTNRTASPTNQESPMKHYNEGSFTESQLEKRIQKNSNSILTTEEKHILKISKSSNTLPPIPLNFISPFTINDGEWNYFTIFVGNQEKNQIYLTRFSQPRMNLPIPKAMAAVWFSFTPGQPPTLTYRFEHQHLSHKIPLPFNATNLPPSSSLCSPIHRLPEILFSKTEVCKAVIRGDLLGGNQLEGNNNSLNKRNSLNDGGFHSEFDLEDLEEDIVGIVGLHRKSSFYVRNSCNVRGSVLNDEGILSANSTGAAVVVGAGGGAGTSLINNRYSSANMIKSHQISKVALFSTPTTRFRLDSTVVDSQNGFILNDCVIEPPPKILNADSTLRRDYLIKREETNTLDGENEIGKKKKKKFIIVINIYLLQKLLLMLWKLVDVNHLLLVSNF